MRLGTPYVPIVQVCSRDSDSEWQKCLCSAWLGAGAYYHRGDCCNRSNMDRKSEFNTGHSATALGSYVTTNNANTIWVQDQPFADWGSAWAWVNQIDCPVIRKWCAIDLVCQKIRFENASAKSSGEIDELIKRDRITLSTIRLH